MKAMERNVNYHKQIAEVTNGIWKAEVSQDALKPGELSRELDNQLIFFSRE